MQATLLLIVRVVFRCQRRQTPSWSATEDYTNRSLLDASSPSSPLKHLTVADPPARTVLRTAAWPSRPDAKETLKREPQVAVPHLESARRPEQQPRIVNAAVHKGFLQCLELRGIIAFDGSARIQSEFHERCSRTPDPPSPPPGGDVW